MRRSSPVVVAASTVIAVLLLPVVVNVATDAFPESWQPYKWLALPAALLLAIPVIVMQVRGNRRSRGPNDAPGASLDAASRQLASVVQVQWTREAEVRSLWRPGPLRLRWSATRRAVTASPAAVLGWDVNPANGLRLKLGGDLPKIVDRFRASPTRQVVVLGEPGAGKTVLAMLLTLGLLERPQPDEPVPVLLSLSSWHPPAEHLQFWLVRRLTEDYPFLLDVDTYGPEAASRLVIEGRVLPVLDGLDEMAPALRSTAIRRLDETAAGGRPLVVTCRTAEYEAAVAGSGEFLTRAAVVELESVGVEDAIGFLTGTQLHGDVRWQPVFAHLRVRPDDHLAQALSTPLMVDMARTAYANPTTYPVELIRIGQQAGRGGLEKRLLDNFVSAVLTARPAPPSWPGVPSVARDRYPAEKAERWLAFLAAHMTDRGTRDLAWWQIPERIPARQRAWRIGLAGGLGWFAGWSMLVGFDRGWWYPGVFTSCLVGGGYAYAIMRAGSPTDLSDAVKRGGFRRLALAVPFLMWLVIGLVLGVLGALTDRLDRSFWIASGLWLVILLLTGTGMWLAGWSTSPLRIEHAANPASTLAEGRRKGGVSAVGAACLVLFVPLALLREPAMVVPFAVLALVVGGGVALRSAWGAYQSTRLWLALTGRLPWRLTSFLGHAHRIGVLRQVGGVYQFRHARLQDRLAEIGERTSTSSTGAGGVPAAPTTTFL